jgi:DNA-binding transcriptional LysR family regulator
MNRTLEMEVFVAVVEAGSFIGAVDGLRMSKAAVSRHVDALEQRLGVRLLQRTTRRLALTDEGRAFHRRCREILAALDDAEAEASSRTVAASGLIRVNAPVSFGIHHLAPLWGEFLQRHPRIELDVTLDDRVVDLFEEGYDLAVRIGMLANSSLVSRRLAATRILLCATPAYLAEHGAPERPADLERHPIIAYSNWASRDEWRFEGPDGPVAVRIRPQVSSNNGDTCRQIGLSRGGIMLHPSFLVADDLREGRLVEVMPTYRLGERGIHAVYPTRKQLPAKVRQLVDYLAEALASPAWD